MNPQHQQKRKIRQSCRRNAVPNRFSSCFSTSCTNGPRSFSRAKVGTHSPSPTGSHTTAHTAKQGAFRMGVVSLLSERSARSPTSPGRVSERQVLPLWGLGRGCSQRTQRASGQRCAYARRCPEGVAAPLGCVIFLQFGDVAVFSLCAQGFPHMRKRGWYHYPRCALCASEMPDGRLQKRLTCRFLRSGGHH